MVSIALSRGDLVIATARRIETIASLKNGNEDVAVLELDLEWESGRIKSVVEEGIKVWGRIDVFVNNAGYSLVGFAEELP